MIKDIRMLKRLQNTIYQVLETHLFSRFFSARFSFIDLFKSQNYARNFSYCNFTSFSYKLAVFETHLVFTIFFCALFIRLNIKITRAIFHATISRVFESVANFIKRHKYISSCMRFRKLSYLEYF